MGPNLSNFVGRCGRALVKSTGRRAVHPRGNYLSKLVFGAVPSTPLV